MWTNMSIYLGNWGCANNFLKERTWDSVIDVKTYSLSDFIFALTEPLSLGGLQIRNNRNNKRKEGKQAKISVCFYRWVNGVALKKRNLDMFAIITESHGSFSPASFLLFPSISTSVHRFWGYFPFLFFFFLSFCFYSRPCYYVLRKT